MGVLFTSVFVHQQRDYLDMRFAARLSMFTVVLTVLCSSPVFAGIIFSHNGASDPTTEGWSVGGTGGVGVSVGGITNDASSGLDAWFVDDTSSGPDSNQSYYQTLSSTQATQAGTYGWSYSSTLRIPNASETPNASPFINYVDGSRDWRMHFGSEADGDPFILLWDGGIVSGVFTGDKYTLQGAGTTYHTYELVFDPTAGTADLFVDGSEVLSDYAGFSTSGANNFSWGAGSSADTGRGNFNSVTFSVNPVPEPSSLALLSLGGLTLVGYGRRRKQTRELSKLNSPNRRTRDSCGVFRTRPAATSCHQPSLDGARPRCGG
jgi:Vibrio cholerae sialidase, lectin insertion/PEP-CTERM motif